VRTHELLGRLRRSLFTKLFLVVVATGVLLLATPPLFMKRMEPNDRHRELLDRNLIHFSSHLVDQLGLSPDPERMARLREDLGLRIAVFREGRPLPGSDALPAPDEALRRDEGSLSDSTGHMVFNRKRNVIVVQKGDLTFLLAPQHGPFQPRFEIAPFLLLLALIMLVGFGVIFWLLRPLSLLSEGVERVARGDLDHPVTIAGHDELAEMAHSFNAMTGKIKDMIRAREQLLLDVSHELRTPLTRLKVALELSDLSHKERMNEDIRELECMITELLESSRLSSEQGGIELEPTELAGLIDEVVAHYASRPPSVVVKTAPVIVVPMDRGRMYTVLGNVLDNALKYSQHQERPVELSATADEKSVTIAIRDYGAGIPADCRQAVFEPFYRVDKARRREAGGFGLGLSLCKKIVDAHHGTITLRAPHGAGTEVVITLRRTA